jgi:Spy/CpxP family protein refolding chaperone
VTIDMSIQRKQNKEDTVKKSIVAISIAGLLIAGLVIAGVAFAGPRDDRPGPGAGAWGCPYYQGGPADTLNLTADQQKKLADLQKKFFTDSDKIIDQVIAKHRQMRDLYVDETPNVKAIDKAQDEIKALSDKRIALSRDFRDKARALLTAEQLKADPYAFMMGPGFGGGFGGPEMMGPGFGGGKGCGPDFDRERGHGFGKWWKHHRD